MLQTPAGLLMVAMLLAGSGRANAQDKPHLSITQPGGMPGMPIITGIARVTNGVKLTWDGPSGYYQLFQRPGVTAGAWQATGTPFNLDRTATVTNLSSSTFFRASGPPPHYAGAQSCAECHSPVLNTVVHTAHFGTFTNALFVAQGGQTNSSCWACHSVGAGLPTGFTSKAVTPQLAGVQCENCHGPAGNHAANPGDPTAVPRVEIAATMCGGCHNAQSAPAAAASFHPPLYEDWSGSPHRAVLDELKADFASPAGTNVFIPTCGRCHSGSVRKAFLENAPLPGAQEASAVGIVCVTCHQPHGVNVFTNALTGGVYTNQLRNALSSLQDYHTAGNFTTNYNAQINVCAQCHNDRGASYQATDRPPHQSPQYNMLLGTVGVLDPLNPDASHFNPGFHGLYITNQCADCHMQTASHAQAQPVSGHKFVVDRYDVCADCHGSAANASNLVVFVSESLIKPQIQAVQASLNEWALTKAPAILGTTNYGTRAWEYTNPGELSPAGPGPNSAEQGLIRTNAPLITIARFNLYLVQYDGSFGTHNPFYSLDLLGTAQSCVQAELNK